ncbi:MAG: hypothetical protein AAFW95_13110, partial [Cyanobacteria bacterium J06638_6]
MGKVTEEKSSLKLSKKRALVTLGSGAFLLGAAVPLATGLTTGAISVDGDGLAASAVGQQPLMLDAELSTLGNAPGVDAFPTVVSSERLCRPPLYHPQCLGPGLDLGAGGIVSHYSL